MRTLRWILGLMMVLGVVTAPMVTAFAQDASPEVVDQPVSTEPDTPDPVVTEPVETEPAETAAPVETEPPAPTEIASVAPMEPTATSSASVEENDFSAAAAPVLTVGGSTDSPASIPFGGQTTVAVSGLGSSMQVFFYSAPVGCPRDDLGRSMFLGPVQGDTSFPRTGSPGTTEYLQAQLYGGEWSNCVQVNWIAAPTATATATSPDFPTPGAMSFIVNGQTSGTLTVNPDDLVTAHAENVSTLIVYSEADCAGVPAYTYGVMLNNVLSYPASEWTHTPAFSMRAYGMDSSAGNCITVTIIQPTSTTVPTDTPTPLPTDTPTGTLIPTVPPTPSPTPAPVLLVDGGTDSLVQVSLGSAFTLHLQDFPTIVWFHGGDCDAGNFWYESTVGYPDLAYNTNAFDPSTFINNQISIRGYSSSINADGQPVTTCRTIEVLGLPTATATETSVPTETPTITPTATTQVLVMTVNGSTDSPVNVEAGAMVTMLTSGLTPGGTVSYGFSQTGCPSSAASPGMQGPYPVPGSGTHQFGIGGEGIAGTSFSVQAVQDGVWSNCIQIIWAAEATATPAPLLLINDSTNPVTHVDYFNGSIAVDWSGIPLLNLYPNTDCSGTPSLYYSAGSGSRTYSAMSWATTVGGYVFSLKGFTSPNPTAITTCRTVFMDNAPITPSVTATTTESATATMPTSTATLEPTATETIEPTATMPTSTASLEPTSTAIVSPTEITTTEPTTTATTTGGTPVTTINGSTDSPVHVPAGAMVTMLTSGLTPNGTVSYGYSQTGCPSVDSSAGIQGPYPVTGAGTSQFQAGGISGVSWYFQATSNGVWLNCFQIIWAAEELTPTETAAATTEPTSTATATAQPTATDTDVPISTPTETPEPTTMATSTATATATAPPSTSTPTRTVEATVTEVPMSPPTATATATATEVSTITPTETSEPTETATAPSVPTSTPTQTQESTATETVVLTNTSTETSLPTMTPTQPAVPTSTLTPELTATGTETTVPTVTTTASVVPTQTSTSEPTATETQLPSGTATETATPTSTATAEPTLTLTSLPTGTAITVATATMTFVLPTASATVTEELPTAISTATNTVPATVTATSEPTGTPPTIETSTATIVPTQTLAASATPTGTEIPPTAVATGTATAIPVGSLQVRVTTSDGGAIPAGTTWLLSRTAPIGAMSGQGPFFAAQIAPDQGGTLATTLPSGGPLPIANPVPLGTYTLTINAAGYRPLVATIDYLDTEGTTIVTAELVAVPASTATTSPAAVATGTVTRPVPSATPTVVSGLPNTGAGEHSSTPWTPVLLLVGVMMALAGFIAMRERRR